MTVGRVDGTTGVGIAEIVATVVIGVTGRSWRRPRRRPGPRAI